MEWNHGIMAVLGYYFCNFVNLLKLVRTGAAAPIAYIMTLKSLPGHFPPQPLCFSRSTYIMIGAFLPRPTQMRNEAVDYYN